MPLLSVRAYARHRRVTHPAVLNAIKTGRITRRKDGKIDSARADKQWAERTDHSKPRNSVVGDPQHRRRADEPSTPMGMTRGRRPGSTTGDPRSADGNGNGHAEDPLSPYAAARGEREQYQALTAKLEYEKAAGLVVDAEAVKQSAYEAGRRARDVLLSLPARVAPILAPVTEEAQVFDVLEKAIREVCEDIMKGLAKPARRGRRR